MDYYLLVRKQKKALKEEYRKTKKGYAMTIRLTKLIVEGLFLILFGIGLIVAGLTTGEMYWWVWMVCVICFVMGLVFLIGQYIIRTGEYNKFLKNKNEVKKRLTKRK